ncbi:MAG: hypothetical protein V2A61_01180 [Calditrichota bacterium]
MTIPAQAGTQIERLDRLTLAQVTFLFRNACHSKLNAVHSAERVVSRIHGFIDSWIHRFMDS